MSMSINDCDQNNDISHKEMLLGLSGLLVFLYPTTRTIIILIFSIKHGLHWSAVNKLEAKILLFNTLIIPLIIIAIIGVVFHAICSIADSVNQS